MRIRGVVVAVAVLSVVLVACEDEDVNRLGRGNELVVFEAAEVPGLLGVAPGDVVAFADRFGDWAQVPVQVDERHVTDIAAAVGIAPAGIPVVAYSDAGTLVGADPDPSLDALDEIVVLARDAGGRTGLDDPPLGVVGGSGVEVEIADPIDGGRAWVYLFERSDPTIDPAAGAALVDYDFRLVAGTYPDDYRFGNGTNPETTSVTAPSYEVHFADRWIQDRLRIRSVGASGVDVLDRDKVWFAPGVCGRTEDTFSAGNGGFLTNRAGPLRVIRDWIGANSGPWTQRRAVFGPHGYEVTTFLRVHALAEAPDDLYDYSAGAIGMTYRNANNLAGLTIDGVPDPEFVPGWSDWELVTGEPGSMVVSHEPTTDIPGLEPGIAWIDDADPPFATCTGDAHLYGTSGPEITGGIPNTDPTLGPARTLELRRVHQFRGPDIDVETAIDLDARARTPMTVQSDPWTP